MTKVNISTAKAKLSELVEQVETQGEPVILCRYGHPVAELIALRRGKRTEPRKELAAVLMADPTSTTLEEWENA